MNLIFDKNGYIEKLDTMYPSEVYKITDNMYFPPLHTTVYGYVIEGNAVLPDGRIAKEGEYFCAVNPTEIMANGTTACFTRVGFRGQPMVGGPIESRGRLTYIDTCSDSLLVYPPRQGDPTLNALYFPPNVTQTYHTHPSLRFGCVASGSGYACIEPDANTGHERLITLTPGTVFCLNEGEVHRFKTMEEPMVVIAYHPDGDWGPTDHNHTMLNRTYKIGSF